MLLLFLDWLFGLTRRAVALRVVSSSERGEATAIVALISIAGSVTLLASTTVTSADLSFDALASTVQSSVERVSGNVEVRGSVIARSEDGSSVDRIELPLGLFGEGAVPLGDEPDGDQLTISYRDYTNSIPSVPSAAAFIGGDGDELLERGELAALSLDLTGLPGVDLSANERFTLELNAPVGGAVEVSRNVPFILQPVMSLH
jgi:hypothetical protein